MVSVFSSKVNYLHAWNNCSHVLSNFEYLCLNKFCNCGHVVFPKGSKENSGLELDQFICKCHCPAASWFCCCWWFCCLFHPCLWFGAAATSLSAIFLTLTLQFLYPYMSNFPFCGFFSFLLSIPDVINLCSQKFNSSHMLEFDDSWKLVTALFLQVSSQTKNPFLTFFSYPFPVGWRLFPSWLILNLRIFFYLILAYWWSRKIFHLGFLFLSYFWDPGQQYYL